MYSYIVSTQYRKNQVAKYKLSSTSLRLDTFLLLQQFAESADMQVNTLNAFFRKCLNRRRNCALLIFQLRKLMCNNIVFMFLFSCVCNRFLCRYVNENARKSH